jgi:hypothetical protein
MGGWRRCRRAHCLRERYFLHAGSGQERWWSVNSRRGDPPHKSVVTSRLLLTNPAANFQTVAYRPMHSFRSATAGAGCNVMLPLAAFSMNHSIAMDGSITLLWVAELIAFSTGNAQWRFSINTETHMAQSSGHRLRSILCRHYKNFSSPWRC